MQFWHDQTHRYHTELQDFKKLTEEAVDGLKNDHGALFKDLEGASVRVDRVEREMDFVETQTSPRACANKADKVVEQEAWGLEESRGEEEEEEDWEELYSRVSGELHGVISAGRPLQDAFDFFIFIHDSSITNCRIFRPCVYALINVSITHHLSHYTPSSCQRGGCSGKVMPLENGKQTGCCYKSFNGVL